jgi:leucyl/phenylalanyl-tRNA--protein transferase
MRPPVDPERPFFPSPETARPNGLLLVGGCLSPQWMLAAYSSGIFPMPIIEGRRETLAWFSPDPRGVIEFDDLYISKRLARTMRQGKFRITTDQAFADVIIACSQPRNEEDGVWISQQLFDGYLRLFDIGHAHSLEVWLGDELAGGIFGVCYGGLFAGESMFHYVTDASKVALVSLLRHLRQQGFELFDVQWTNSHTRSLGASEIPRDDYLERLATAVKRDVSFGRIG